MIVLEFDDLAAWRESLVQLRRLGLQGLEAHSPGAVEGVSDLLEAPSSPVRPVMLVCAIVSGLAIWALQYWHAVIAYPINSGGRPPNSWPAFGFPILDVAILGAAIGGFVALLLSCGLPALHHPFFEDSRTEAASDNRFFITMASVQAYPVPLSVLAGFPCVIAVFEVPS